ncbi:MAG TPA: hypothetical protein VER17_06165 [Tepidisphaeraceae bacterium]|nr:hypothetical protein [Tepidisphaeraceae bacterium]
MTASTGTTAATGGTAKPDPAVVQRAIDAYVRVAYPDGPPVAVRSMLATEKTWRGDLVDAPVFVKDPPLKPTRWSMRLGNRHYPHMKLVIEQSPAGEGFLFRADAHDAHCCPPAHAPEHAAFRELMTQNQAIITEVEHAWAAAGVPTLKTYLQEDLARRRAEAAR